jgi:hypothetical protein
MVFGLPSIGNWLGEKLSRNPDTITRAELDLMSRIELINTIEQLQVKLDAERQARSELNKEILGIFIRA